MVPRRFLLLAAPFWVAGVLLSTIASAVPLSWGAFVGSVGYYLLACTPVFSGLAGFLTAQRRRWLWGIVAAIAGVPFFYFGLLLMMLLRELFGFPL